MHKDCLPFSLGLIESDISSHHSTIMASTSQAYSDQLQQLNESRQPVLYGLNIALTLLATCAVSLRLFARRISKLPLSYDDYAILTALVSSSWSAVNGITLLTVQLGCYGLFIINMISQSP